MKTKKLHFAFTALAMILFVITEASAQTYVKTFTFGFPENSFALEEDGGGDCISPDFGRYNWAYGEDLSKPALPYISYQILLPDNFRIKSYTFSTRETWFAENVTLMTNPTVAPISTEGTDEEQPPYPLVKYSAEAVCNSEDLTDGYRIADFCINPFTYHANNGKLALATSFKLTITIEPVEGEKVTHTGSMTNLVKSIVINPDDMDKGTETWECESPIRCTVGSIGVEEWNMIDYLYTKDWHIRFTNPEHLNQTAQAGIVADSVHNGTAYQVIVMKKNGEVTDTLLYRQKGNKVYRYNETAKEDLLLFDFGLSKGDSFTATNGQVWIVDEVSETEAYGNCLEKSLTLKGREDGEVKDIWIENVGSLYTGIFSQTDLAIDAQARLTCCRQADDYLPWIFGVDTKHYKAIHFQSSDPETKEDEALCNEIGYDEQLFAEFIGNTLRLYGKMRINCYTYMLECRIQDGTIRLNSTDIHHGEELDCLGSYWVDIRIPGFVQGEYDIRYTPWYGGEEINLGTANKITTFGKESTTIHTLSSSILCTSLTATLLEVYTMDAVKVGEASFLNGKASVTVDKVPSTYLYIVTYPDGRRESGKVMISE